MSAHTADYAGPHEKRNIKDSIQFSIFKISTNIAALQFFNYHLPFISFVGIISNNKRRDYHSNRNCA